MPVSISGAGSISGLDQGFNVTTGSVGVGTTNPRTDLQVGAFGGGDSNIQLATGTSGASNILFGDSSAGSNYYKGFIKYNHSTDNLELYTTDDLIHYTGGSERLRITSAGLVGVNCTPLSQFQVKTGADQNIALSSMSSEASIEAYNDAGSANVPLRLRASAHKFFIGSTEGLHIDSSGNLLLKTGEIDIQGGNKTVKTSAGFLQVGTSGSHYLSLITAGLQRLNITSGGNVGIGINNPAYELEVASSDTTTFNITAGGNTNLSRLFFSDNDAVARGYLNYNHNGDNLIIGAAGAEKLRIASDGTVHINSPDSASGGRIYATSSKLYLQSGNGRQSFNIADMASGQSATHEFNSSGNLVLAGSASAKNGVTLTDTDTSARLNVNTDLSGNYTGWKERNVAAGSMSQASIDSKTPTLNDFTYPNNSNGMLIWSTSKIGFAAGGESPQYGTGVQMLFDSAGLMLGGNRAFDRTSSTSTSTNWNLKLNTAGSAVFKGSLEADPVQLDGNDSWIKSTYGSISNSTVLSLNNLMIGQNMRGWIGTRDGGSPNNNFYHVTTHGAMGYCGTEYCYGAITKFYNNTGATTANATFTPNETVRFDTSGLTVNNGLRISTTSGGTSLANPYSIGLVSTATIPSYPHFTGIWVVTGSVPCNNTWYDLLHSINDSNGMFHGYSGDASSKNIFQYQYSLTSPAYGVNILSQRFMNGAWNTGSVSFQLRNNSGPWTLQIKATSHYNSNNNAGFRIMFHSYY